jgi:hypothetical protein
MAIMGMFEVMRCTGREMAIIRHNTPAPDH